MIDKKSGNLRDESVSNLDDVAAAISKESWAKPEIVDYQPVTIARGVQYRIGDGVSNLS